MRKKILITASMFTVFAMFTAEAHASGWVDDWLSQKSGSGASYIEGQERGYYSGGNMSMRWQDTTSYPITTNVPHIKSGCGGIDVFMGGFSFMNADYLTKKLQSILSNASAVAFDLALKTLCEQCANTITKMESISDSLNHLQMSECAAGKSLVATVADATDWKLKDADRAALGEAISYDKISNGVSDMWTTLTTSQRAANNVPTTADRKSVTSGCSTAMQDIFLKDGLLLNNLGNEMGLPASYTNLMRGLVGDVRLEITNNNHVSYVAPCPQNNPEDVGAATTGKMYSQDTSESCSQITDSNKDLTNYVTQTLTTIANDMQNKGTMSDTEIAFLKATPLSTLPILKVGVATNTTSETIANLADVTAKAFALQMMSDLYTRTNTVAMKARELLGRQSGATSGVSDTKCADATFAPGIDKNLAEMINRIQVQRKAAQAAYSTSAAQLSANLQLLQNKQQQEAQVDSIVRKRFGDFTALVDNK